MPLVILAAGESSRMGAVKGLIEIGGIPLVSWQCQRFRDAGGRDICVVLGASAAMYLAAAPGLPHVINPQPERGPFSSLQVGLRHFAGRSCFVLPVDVPAAKTATWVTLATALTLQVAVVRPRFDGRGGHPVLLSAPFAAALIDVSSTDPAARLDMQIRALPPAAVIDIEVDDPSLVINLNQPSDLERFKSERR